MSNYDAWNIAVDKASQLKTSEEIYKYLIGYAILAPSSHNSQPWCFRLTDSGIKVMLAKQRLLPVGDPDNRLSLISIGAAIENIITACGALGLEAKLLFNSTESESIIAMININGHILEKYDKSLLENIARRVTVRGPYKNIPFDKNFIKNTNNIATLHNTSLHIIDSSDLKKELAEIVTNSSVSLMNDKEFRNELSSHILHNSSTKPTGMPASGMGIPDLPSYLAPLLLKHVNMQKLSKKEDVQTLTIGSPALFTITTLHDSIVDRINAGRVFEQISLQATKNGMRTSVWGSGTATQNSRNEISALLRTSEIPQLVFRIGVPEKDTPHSPRLSVLNVVESI